jgi:hypothetical protein
VDNLEKGNGDRMKTFGIPTIIMLVVVTLLVEGHGRVRPTRPSWVKDFHDDVLIKRNGSYLGVYTDGWVCYHRPNEVAAICTRAIPKPTYKEIQ